MKIEKKAEDDKLTVAVEGRLDTATAPQLEDEMKESITGITELIFDFTNLEYISSAGLRVLLSVQKTMNKQGSMIVRGTNSLVMEIFETTGFVNFLNFE